MGEGGVKSLGAALFLVLGGITYLAFANDGSNGFANAITFNLTSLQIWVDLVIAVIFWCAWLIVDARQAGRNPWPWIIAALIVGCFAPLAYMIVYGRWPASSLAASAGGDAGRRKAIGWVVTLAFAALTIAALVVDGGDIPAVVTHTWSNFQIWFDLVIAIVLWIAWVLQDAKRAGRNPWGWIVLALIIGAFSPLIYLMVHGRWPASHPAST